MNLHPSRTLSIAVLAACILLPGGCSKDGERQPDGAAPSAGSAPAPGKQPAQHSVTATVPAGAALKVRTTTALSTETNKPGDTFTATLEEPLSVGNSVVAPKGAKIDGQIVESDKGGRVKGRARLAIQLSRLHTPDGHSLEISTGSVVRQARGTKGEDAAKIGIGSGVGAAIGAIAGGGKGAAVGAAAGAGAGTGVVLATRGDAAAIPSETVLSFQLRSPVTVTQKK